MLAGKTSTWEGVASQPNNTSISLKHALVSKGSTLELSLKTEASHSRDQVLKVISWLLQSHIQVTTFNKLADQGYQVR